MKNRVTGLKQTAVLALSAAVIFTMMPVQAHAEEAAPDGIIQETDMFSEDTEGLQDADTVRTEAEGADREKTIGTGTGSHNMDLEETGEALRERGDLNDGETGGTTTEPAKPDSVETGSTAAEQEKPDSVETGGLQTDPADPDGQDPDDDSRPEDTPGSSADPMAAAVPMDSSNELYGSLSQFLTLSADRFRIYTVALLDPSTGMPVQAQSPVRISLEVPSDYDTGRLAVSEITAGGQTPERTEIACTYKDGKVTFETDHSGIYVVMEKKDQKDLPSSLEMTEKVDKLQLTKTNFGSTVQNIAIKAYALNPQTGDDHSVLIWGSVTAAAAAAVIVLIVIIIKRRK